MKQSQYRYLALTVSLLLTGALSPIANAQVTVPNVFENGKIADADEVNENFKALADGINSLPAGVKGEQGDQGPPGPAGATGPAGAPGASCTVSECAASATATLACGDNTSVEVPCVKGYKTVFVSSGRYGGNRGGLQGADALCQGLANDAGLDGTYLAWLADNTGSPSTRFSLPQDLPYRQVNGPEIASSYQDLFQCNKNPPQNLCLFSGLEIDENGSPVGPSRVWSNVDPNTGNAVSTLPGAHCKSWGDPFGDGGNIGTTFGLPTSIWTNNENRVCESSGRLYCFEQ